MKAILSCAGKLLDLGQPVVMGILNLTPDSFYDGGFYPSIDDQLKQVDKMWNEGASIIDIGAVSTRPNAAQIDGKEETRRLVPSLEAISKHFPDVIISVDTYRSGLARIAIDNGAGMINDIYGGRFEPEIIDVVQSAGVPYIIMHMQGDPKNMQIMPYYKDVVGEISTYFQERIRKFSNSYNQIILDPGFGFGKTVSHNFQLLNAFQEFKNLGYPLMAGLSRKSMINRVLGTHPSEALNGTTVLNTVALQKGADILRVHDVKEALQAIRLVGSLNQ